MLRVGRVRKFSFGLVVSKTGRSCFDTVIGGGAIDGYRSSQGCTSVFCANSVNRLGRSKISLNSPQGDGVLVVCELIPDVSHYFSVLYTLG